VWGVTLSGPLPVVGMVRRYRTIYLMGRSPLLKQLAFFLSSLYSSEAYAVLASLSRRYPTLEGRLATCYSPVRHYPCGSSDLHVLGTPPAFILSQDQTLRMILGLSCFSRSSLFVFLSFWVCQLLLAQVCC
jgi:uncharacterized membrane protein YwaF